MLRVLFYFFGVAHLVFGFIGIALPGWFFNAVPPWPPLHVGQIQIAGVFDLSLGTGFLVAARDMERYSDLMILVGIVGEVGHACVRIGHVIAGDNPSADLMLPAQMLAFGVVLIGVKIRRLAASHRSPARP